MGSGLGGCKCIASPVTKGCVIITLNGKLWYMACILTMVTLGVTSYRAAYSNIIIMGMSATEYEYLPLYGSGKFSAGSS